LRHNNNTGKEDEQGNGDVDFGGDGRDGGAWLARQIRRDK